MAETDSLCDSNKNNGQNELIQIADRGDHLYNLEYFTVLKKEVLTEDGGNEGVFKVFTYRNSLRFFLLFRKSPCGKTINDLADQIMQYVDENKKGVNILWYSQIDDFSDDLLNRLHNYTDPYHFFCYRTERDDIDKNVDMKGLTYQKCSEDMIDTCIDILEEVFTPFPDSPGSFKNDKERITADFLYEKGGTFLFYKDNELIGFCGHKDGHITETVVRKEFQGQGYGEVIVRTILKLIYDAGYDAELTVRHDNKNAISLYQKAELKKVYESKRVTLPCKFKEMSGQ